MFVTQPNTIIRLYHGRKIHSIVDLEVLTKSFEKSFAEGTFLAVNTFLVVYKSSVEST